MTGFHKMKFIKLFCFWITDNANFLGKVSGLNAERLVEARGGFESASCILCLTAHDPDVVRLHVMRGDEPRCLRCNVS